MKKVKNTLTKRLLAMLLCIIMVAAMLPTVIQAKTEGNRTVDPSTADSWKDMFGTAKLDTEYAGGVWTDKSVFLDADEFASATNTKGEKVTVGEDNFLVALSALAATKEIKGYSTLPTDTVLVLDLSQSMDNSDSVPSMITAANSAIQQLLELNNYNRVGVVAYSGNPNFGSSAASTAQTLLPLGRYTTGTSGKYLTNSYTAGYWDGYGWDQEWVPADTTVSVASDLKVEGTNQTAASSSKNTIGGTYMQNGIYQGWKLFEAVEDTEIATGNILGGTKRIPIMVLMSDGAPTTANSAYAGTYGRTEAQTLTPASLGASNAGNGGTATNSLGFLTQLTAAFAKAKMEEKYGRDAMFYTLGLDLASQDADGASVAAAVLNPTTSNSTIRSYWSTVAGLTGNQTMSLTVPGTGGNANNKTVAVSGNAALTSADQMLYADRYFSADDSSALNSAFQSIVDEIILQSKYYPTLVPSGEHDVDGYISFGDELGEFMNIKQVEGLVIGDMLFTGSALIDEMLAGNFGNASNWTPLGQEMLDSVAERLHVPYDTAATLASLAWRDGQLGKSDTGVYSNYIGWYGDENNAYLGFWDKDHTELDYPEKAVYFNKSYGFYGKDSDVPGGDMMHIIVMTSQNIETGQQGITFRIPANLIPMVTYNIELEGYSLDEAKNITMTIDRADPIQLLVEVGLREEVNELTIHEIAKQVEEENASGNGHHHLHYDQATGTYSFYTNRWGSGDGGAIDYTQPQDHLVTMSHFTPSMENERFYYTEDSIIYSDANGTEYSGSTKPSGTGYYHVRKIFTLTGSGSAAAITDKYMPIDASVLDEHATYNAEEGFWYIPKGAVYKEVSSFRQQKNPNETKTLDYVDYPLVHHPATSTANDDYEIYNFLGNNGKLVLAPATGITLTKTVDTVLPGTRTDNFAFEIALTAPAGTTLAASYPYTWEKADGTTATGTFAVTGGKITVNNVAGGDVIHITGMAAGISYTITELAHDTYKVASSTGSGETVLHAMKEADFVNTPIEDGALIVSKAVVHPLGSDYVIPANIKFNVQVTLTRNGAAYANEKVTTSLGEKTTDANGVITFEIAHNESVSITGLPEGVGYTVEETGVASYFTQSGSGLNGTIEPDVTKEAKLVNTYTPSAATPSIEVVGTKTIGNGGTFEDTYAFKFVLERWNGTEWVVVATDTVTSTDATYDLTSGMATVPFDKVGTYYFRVYEDDTYNPNNVNMSHIIYDTTKKYFDVVVTDTDMNGALEISEVTNATKNASGQYAFTFRADVENVYSPNATASVTIPISKTLTNDTGVELAMDNFSFALYDTAGNKIDGTEVVMGQSGKTSMTMVYHSSELDDVTPDAITSVKTKTVEYQLKEVVPAEADRIPGVTYSTKAYKVAVTLTLDGANNFTATAKLYDGSTEIDMTQADANFENKYDLGYAEFTISGTKKLTNTDPNGKSEQELLNHYGESFQFELYQATGSDFAVSPSYSPIILKADKNGNFSYSNNTITNVGTLYWVLKETAGDKDEIGYDDSVYHVTVVVSQDPSNPGKLMATTTIDEYGADNNTSIVFENTYTPAETSAVLGGTKTLEGRDLHHGEFTFELTGDGLTEAKTAVNAANTGKFQFEPITYTKAGTYTYTITEKVPANKLGGVTYNVDNCTYTATVVVADNGTGELEVTSITYAGGTSTTEAAFKNTYEAAPVDVVIEADKTLTGRDLKAGEFKFGLFPADPYFEVAEDAQPVATATNAADGSVVLTKTFYQVGTGNYVLMEITDDPLGGVTYDPVRHNLSIQIFDVENGQLNSIINKVVAGENEHYDHEDDEPFAFTNTYHAAPVSVTLSGIKTLEKKTLKADEFTFVLQELDKDGKKLGDPTSVKNAADGAFSFELDYTAAGTYYYTLTESQENPSLDVAYDDTVYEITVTVTDNGEGKLVAAAATKQGAAADKLNFTNTYDPTLTPKSGSAVVAVEKIVKSTYGVEVGLENFEFSLQRVDEAGKDVGKAVTAKSDDKGDASFTLAYNEKDIGKTFTYILTEVNTGVKDMVYSTDSYKVTVKVDVSTDGKGIAAAAAVTKNGEPVQAASFENVYNGQKDKPVNGSPTTGEEMRIMVIVLVMLISAAGIVALVLLRRKSNKR